METTAAVNTVDAIHQFFVRPENVLGLVAPAIESRAALFLRRLRIGTEIDPGVPWTLHLGEPVLHLAFKSGNFGSEDFFLKALKALERS